MADDWFDIDKIKIAMKKAAGDPIPFAFGVATKAAECKLAMYIKRDPEFLRKMMKKEGFKPAKIIVGTARTEGALLIVTCEAEVPNAKKFIKAYLKETPLLQKKVQLMGPDGEFDADTDEENEDGAGPEAAGQTETGDVASEDTEALAGADLKGQSLEALKALQAALQSLPPEAIKKFGKPYKTLVEGHKSGKYEAVITAAQKLIANIQQTQATAGSAGSGEASDEATENLTASIEEELKSLAPGIKNILSSLPSLKRDIALLVTTARSKAAAGDERAASGALLELKALIDKSGKQGAVQDSGNVSVMKLGKARLEWIGVRETALKDVATLQSRIRAAFASQPDLGKAVEAGISRLDKAINKISDDLSRELDEVLNESDAATRAKKAEDVTGMTRNFIKMVVADPIISAIDGTVYMPGISVVAPLKKSLDNILSALGQTATAAD